jgi:hypothetical protein
MTDPGFYSPTNRSRPPKWWIEKHCGSEWLEKHPLSSLDLDPNLLAASNGLSRMRTTKKPPRPWGPLATVLAFMLLAFAITMFLLTVAGLF